MSPTGEDASRKQLPSPQDEKLGRVVGDGDAPTEIRSSKRSPPGDNNKADSKPATPAEGDKGSRADQPRTARPSRASVMQKTVAGVVAAENDRRAAALASRISSRAISRAEGSADLSHLAQRADVARAAAEQLRKMGAPSQGDAIEATKREAVDVRREVHGFLPRLHYTKLLWRLRKGYPDVEVHENTVLVILNVPFLMRSLQRDGVQGLGGSGSSPKELTEGQQGILPDFSPQLCRPALKSGESGGPPRHTYGTAGDNEAEHLGKMPEATPPTAPPKGGLSPPHGVERDHEARTDTAASCALA